MPIDIIARYDPTYNRNNLPVPIEDPRMNPSSKLSYEEFQQTKKQMLQAYQITIRLLSRTEPTDLSQLRHTLLYDYFFSSSVVEDLFYFITTHDTKHIEFAEEEGCLKSEQIYLRPRIRLSIPAGPASLWMPYKQ